MNPTEFSDWIGGHRAASKKVREFWVGMNRIDKGRVWLEWESELRPLSKNQAVKATQRMVNSGEINELPVSRHPARILEIAASINDPVTERRKQQQEQIAAQARREEYQRLEAEHGAALDGISFEELLELAEGVAGESRRNGLKKMIGLVSRKNRMVRPTLLKLLAARSESPVSTGTAMRPLATEEHAVFREELFGGLPPRSEINYSTNDQYDKE